MKLKLLAISLFCLAATIAFADENDGAYLDAPYNRPLKEVRERARLLDSKRRKTESLDAIRLSKSDTHALIALQSPVKAQANRGTCSIFSSTALLESMMIIQNRADVSIDLSEEWLEYVLMRNRTEDGSNSQTNFTTLLTHSTVHEETLPYIGETWESVDSSFLARERCGKLFGRQLTSCLIAHRNPQLFTASDADLSNSSSELYDPEFLNARREAKLFAANLSGLTRGAYYRTFEEAKELLAAGIPLTLDFDFYYGAWNHRKSTELGMTRNLDNWSKGIVGYPEYGSIDRTASPTQAAGHSVVAVGFDDNVEVTIPVQMANGEIKEVTYRGVIYFKNSWGTTSFGNTFMLDGQNYQGYGMMVYKYAEEEGTFYELPQK